MRDDELHRQMYREIVAGRINHWPPGEPVEPKPESLASQVVGTLFGLTIVTAPLWMLGVVYLVAQLAAGR